MDDADCPMASEDEKAEWTCKPGSVAARMRAARRPFLYGADCSTPPAAYPEVVSGRTSPKTRCACAHASCFLFGLAPGGVYLAEPVTRPAGELLPHRFTLTADGRTIGGGLLSAALALALRPVGVTDHPVLRSPDFPPVATQTRDRRPSSPLRTSIIQIILSYCTLSSLMDKIPMHDTCAWLDTL